MVSKLVSIPSKITSTRQTVISTARMTPYVFLVADNTPFATFTSAVFVPACQMHVFTWQFLFLFRIYFATVPTDMVAYMWNTDRNTVFVRVIDILDVTAAPPQEPVMKAVDPEPVTSDGQAAIISKRICASVSGRKSLPVGRVPGLLHPRPSETLMCICHGRIDQNLSVWACMPPQMAKVSGS